MDWRMGWDLMRWNEDVSLWKSPDFFWMLNSELTWRPSPRIQSQLMLTPEGERYIGSNYLNTTLVARRRRALKGLGDDPVAARFLASNDRWRQENRRKIMGPEILWADRATHKIAAKILSGNSNFSKASRETLDSFLNKGSGSEKAKAENYILLYLDRLNDRASSKNDSERRSAVQELGKFLNIYPSFRERLPDELSVAADKLEGEGAFFRHNPSRNSAKTMTASSLIARCQQLWERYYKKPTKKNLQAVFDHLEVMKSSKSEKVKQERVRCLRAANKEVVRL